MAQDSDIWIPFAVDTLLSVPEDAIEQYYYGPYNIILTRAFPATERFIVFPQTYSNAREAVGCSIEYKVVFDGKVVILVDIKRENILQYEFARVEADLRVHDRFQSMHKNIASPEIVAISAFGRLCRVYRYNTATHQITSDSGEGLYSFRWDIDLQTTDGRTRLSNIFHKARIRATDSHGKSSCKTD